MLVSQGEARQLKLTSGTYSGISIGAFLQAAATNTAIGTADWSPASINIKVILKRNKAPHMIMQDNLLLLGTGNSLLQGLHFDFFNGTDLVYPASGVKNLKLHNVFLDFGGPVRVSEQDELNIEVTIAKSGAFTSAIDANNSHVEFEAVPCIGYPNGIYSTSCEVLQVNSSKQAFNLGDNVDAIVILNFDKNTLESPVIVNLSLQSDRLDMNLNFNQLLLRNAMQSNPSRNMRYGSVLPIAASDATGRVFRGLDQYPQSFIILQGEEIDTSKLHLSLNSAQVAASQNYVFYRSFQTSQSDLIESERRQKKHFRENIQKLPASL